MTERRRIRIGILGAGGYGCTARECFRHTGEYDVVACMVGHHERYSPIARLTEKVFREERLGRLCNVFVTCCSGSTLGLSSKDWRAQAGKNPGGPMLQCGIHKIDLLLSVLGPVERVSAMIQDDITRFEPVDNTITMMAFRNGVQATFVCNYATAYLHTMHFLGTEANLHEPWQPLPLPRHDSYAEKHGCVLEKSSAGQIRTGQPDYNDLGESTDALRVVHAAMESRRTGRVVELCP